MAIKIQNVLIDFASRLGKLEQSIEDLDKHFTNHLSNHKAQKWLQWFILALQVVVILFLGSSFI